MALALMTDLLRDAEREGRAVGAFNVATMGMIMGAVRAAETARTPIILQIAQVRLKYSPFHLIAPMMVSAAREAQVPIAVHFDHGQTQEAIKAALAYGFTSVMFDGSSFSLQENIEKTGAVVTIAKEYHAGVEAELGVIGGSEDGTGSHEMITSDPESVAHFLSCTPVDALAVAIGNAHGHYRGKPNLSFEVLKRIRDITRVPLVLHGGTGISDDDFRRCIDLGVRKINIATASFDAAAESIRTLCSTKTDADFFSLHEAEVQGVYENVLKHINIFNRS